MADDYPLGVIPKEPAISYSRPVDPRTCDARVIAEQERKLARAVQLHKCSLTTCLKSIDGRLKCKRRAPFKIAPDDWVDANGEWGPKRYCAFFNNWNPTLLRAVRSNHDIKLILNGAMTKSITWYITNYATKKQQRSSNVTAILAKKYAFHKYAEKRTSDVKLANKKLIQRCANALSSCHEFSAPEIMSYLMGWGDRYESHIFAPIYWDSAMRALRQTFPELYASHTAVNTHDTERRTEGEGGSSNVPEETSIPEADVTITFVADTVLLRDQLKDYQFRGDALEEMSLFEFIVETYEGLNTKASTERDNGDDESVDPEERSQRLGRPRSVRVPYREEAGKSKMCRVVRGKGHDTVPRIVGKWFPRNDDPICRDLYCASMALLLKPWRKISELKQAGETFEGNWTTYLANLTERQQRVVDNIQYYHECADSARERKLADAETEESAEGMEFEYEGDEDEDQHDDTNDDIYAVPLTEDDVQKARENKLTAREQLFSEHGVQIATDFGFFPDTDPAEVVYGPSAKIAATEDIHVINGWAKQLKETTRRQFDVMGRIDLASTNTILPSIAPTSITSQESQSPEETLPSTENAPEIPPNVEAAIATIRGEERLKYNMLNTIQRRAHDIVERTLREELAGVCAEQLKMMILGQGGTGKSLLISGITETFEFFQASSLLAKCATSGIAASEIKGQTLHSWAGIAIRQPKDEDWLKKSSKASQAARARNINGKAFLVVDEISMAYKATFYTASQIVGQVKAAAGEAKPGPFGGTHTIITGDFHQFPPVANAAGALYQVVHSQNRDVQRAQLGRQLYEEFDKVVILKDQVRARDTRWIDILTRLRVGDCTDEDIAEIRKLVLTNPECEQPDFTKAPWKDAILVTSRHSVRECWNAASLKKHCQATGQIRYIVHAEDTLRPKDDPIPLNVRVKIVGMTEKSTSRLREVVEIAVGMKAMVVLNLSTEADIANGTRGTISKIILDPREQPADPDEEGAVKLKYPPAMVLFEPDCGTDIEFPGLPRGVVPITPSACTFNVQTGKQIHKIKRRQLAITAGYAFTDYKAQGQTIEYVIIDIGKPPSGALSPFSTYVALSRSRGRDTIRLLRDFDANLFTTHPSEALRVEMNRLEELDRITERETHSTK